MKAASVVVLDAEGRKLSPTTPEKAKLLLAKGKAALVSDEPFTIQLPYSVELPLKPREIESERVGEGKRILLHICCGPCSTYPIEQLREEGFQVTGFWYNPNIHPWQEHQRRRESVQKYAEAVGLPVIWHEKYEMPLYLRAVVGHERFRERCRICYRMRLEKTARVAAEGGFDAFTTTLLISPHQDQALIRQIGEEVAEELGAGALEFYFENFRRGWSERGRLTHEHDLYRQQYCGCIYSEWERYNQRHIDDLLGEMRNEATRR
jgi:predicted adenine nucleotide alpha hydrolase (AANH) superfamily ATPase